jgi:hypothetical protein
MNIIDVLQATEFGAYPDNVSLENIERIESKLTNLRKIGSNLSVSMGDHPTLGSVLILNRDDGEGGFVFADHAAFA